MIFQYEFRPWGWLASDRSYRRSTVFTAAASGSLLGLDVDSIRKLRLKAAFPECFDVPLTLLLRLGAALITKVANLDPWLCLWPVHLSIARIAPPYFSFRFATADSRHHPVGAAKPKTCPPSAMRLQRRRKLPLRRRQDALITIIGPPSGCGHWNLENFGHLQNLFAAKGGELRSKWLLQRWLDGRDMDGTKCVETTLGSQMEPRSGE